jgi:hypothetical protein
VSYFHPIERVKLDSAIAYNHIAELPELVHLEDPAFNSMLNLKKIQAATINAHSTIQQAKLEMKACNAHMLLVLNDHKQTIGLITSEDILGTKPIKISSEKDITGDQIQVCMIMQTCDNLLAFNYEHIAHANVGQIIQTMIHHHQHYALVVEIGNLGIPILSGLFSLFHISRQLHVNLMDNHVLEVGLSELKNKA